jgi:hypothetical protein
MSEQIIEQLAKEHLKPAQILEYGAYTLTDEQLLKICKAYQAAAPIDNVAEELEKAAKVCDGVKAVGITVSSAYAMGANACAVAIRALIPDTQANAQPTQGQSKKIVGYITPSDLEFPFAYPNLGYEADWRNIPVYVDVPAAPIESERE